MIDILRRELGEGPLASHSLFREGCLDGGIPADPIVGRAIIQRGRARVAYPRIWQHIIAAFAHSE